MKTIAFDQLAAFAAEPAVSWSLGPFGAIGEFHREPDEPATLRATSAGPLREPAGSWRPRGVARGAARGRSGRSHILADEPRWRTKARILLRRLAAASDLRVAAWRALYDRTPVDPAEPEDGGGR